MGNRSQNFGYPAPTQEATTDPTAEQAINAVVRDMSLDGDIDGFNDGALGTQLPSNPATQQSIEAIVLNNLFAKGTGRGINENIAAQQITAIVDSNQFHGYIGGGVNCDLGAMPIGHNWDRVAQRPQTITAIVENNAFGGDIGGGINDNLGAVSRGGNGWDKPASGITTIMHGNYLADGVVINGDVNTKIFADNLEARLVNNEFYRSIQGNVNHHLGLVSSEKGSGAPRGNRVRYSAITPLVLFMIFLYMLV